MQQGIKRFCALILCAVMILNMVPVQVVTAATNEQEESRVLELRFYPDCESDEYVLVGGKHTLEFNPSGNPYRFEIRFADPSLIGYAFVSSTIHHEKAVLDAHYDAETGLFVTEGYFEPGGKDYIPDDIHVEYTLKTSAPAVGSDVDWDEMTGLLSEDLRNSSVSNVTTGENSTGSVRFSDGVKGLEDVAMDYAIHSVVDSTALGQIRNEYESAEKVLRYVVPGLDDARYYAHLDMSDPNTLKMMVDDGLDAGGKAIELTMSFLNESNMEQQALREISESLSDVGTAVGVIGDMYHIHREMDGLRDEVATADYITDKDTALTAIDNLEADQIAFALIVTMIPIIATGGMATGPAAAMFTSIIGVMSAASDTVYKQRIATIMEKPSVSQASWGEFSLYGGAPSGFVWELYPEYNTLRFRFMGQDAGTGILASSSALNVYDSKDHIKDGVHRIVIEDGAIGLSSKAISEFDALEELELPHSLRTIGYESIYDCNALEDMDIPEGVTQISGGAFYLSNNLKSISLPLSLTELGKIATKCPQLTDVYYAGNADQWERISGHQLMENQAFTVHLKYPGGALDNGFSWYFDQQTGTLTITGSADMPRLPQEDPFSDVIYPWHFFDGKITRVVLSEGITSIPQYAFQNHEEITEVVLPKSLKSIDWHAFENCTALEKITLPENLESIGDYAFAGTGLTEIYIPKSVANLGHYLFSGSTELKTAVIDVPTEEIPIGIFDNCTSLTDFTVPDTVTVIGGSAFSGCTSLKHVTISPEVTHIGFEAFANCTGLESVAIPVTVDSLDNAFMGCTNLKDVYYDSSPTAWDSIDGSNTESLASATKHYTSAGRCGEEVTWDFEETTGVLTISGKGEMYSYGSDNGDYAYYEPWRCYRDQITGVVIEDGVQNISELLFYMYSNLEYVSIPDSVTSIGAAAFLQSGLKELVIPDSVTIVGTSIAAYCENLESATIGKGLDAITASMFENTGALKQIIIPENVTRIEDTAFYGSGLTSIAIPNSVTSIGKLTFAWCRNLETVYMSSAVTSVESRTFGNCENLSEVYFEGNAPSFAEDAFLDTTTTVYYPADNATWTSDIMQNYGGKITWQSKSQACNHTEIVVPGRAPTCTEAGLTDGKKCSVCGEVTVDQQTIPVEPHTYDNNVDGTCNVCGVNRETVEDRVVVHMFRMYNPNTGEHFYTGSEVEKANLIGHGWQYEGVGFTFPANTGDPVHRLFQPSTGEHLYTMDNAEKETLMANGWNYEGIAFNSAYDTEAVQHRLHNPNATVGAYHFTFSLEEKQNLIDAGWEYQGIGWYSCWK